MTIKAIFGLGNPGEAYTNTRHNIGFKFINTLRHHCEDKGTKKVKFKSHIYTARNQNRTLLLVKPQTYMNLSGQALQAVMNFYKLSCDEICIIADDIDIEFGTIRVRKKGGPGTHNGLKSIINTLGSGDFLRIRLGIGHPPKQMQLSDYVLQNFSDQEQDFLTNFLENNAKILLENINQTKDNLLNKLNS